MRDQQIESFSSGSYFGHLSHQMGLSFVVLCVLTIQFASAQEIGFRPVIAPEPVELGFVENASGDLHLEIPLGSFPQRGTGVPTVYRYTYDSGIWMLNPIQNVWMINPLFASPQGGWQLVSTSALKVYFSTFTTNCTTYFDFLWLDASGTDHEFPITTSTCSLGSPNGDAFAADSSGYHMYVTNYSNAKVYAPDGTLVCEAPAVTDSNNHYIDAEDANGNFYTQTYGDQLPPGFFDTTGRQALQSYATAPTTFNSQGTYSQYGVTYASIPVKTAFGQSGVTEYSGSITVIQSITLPAVNGVSAQYVFKYDCDSGTGNAACGSPSGQSGYYGVLTSLTLPTGGTVSYGYETFSDSYGSRSRWLNSRTSAGGTWSYTPQVISTCSSTQVGCQEEVTVAKPSGTSTVYTFTLNNGAWPTEIQNSDSSGSLLSTITNTYDFSVGCPFNYSFSPCYGAGYVRLLTTQTSLPTPGGNISKKTQLSYDSPQTGNVTAAKEWRYYSGSFPSAPDRETDTTYLSTGTNDINKPLSVTIKNSSGSMVAQTLDTYDSYSGSCPGGGLSSISGATNHDDTNFGSGYTARGNLTQVQRLVSGSSYLTTTYCYDTTGQVTEKFDSAGNPTQYGYADSFFNDTGSDASGQGFTHATNAYVTSITSPIIGTRHLGYYYGSGKLAFITDENNATTYHHYMDSLDRPTEIDAPLGWSLQTYPSETEIDAYAAVGDTSASTSCSSCRHGQILLDSFGRETQQSTANAPGGAINVVANYDPESRITSESHAYTTTSDPNYVFEGYFYDGLDRAIQVSHPDGQSSKVVYGAAVAQAGGLASQQGSTSIYGTGYPVLMVDEEGKEKQEWIDGFGRIIEVDEPSPGNGASVGSATISGQERSGYFQVCIKRARSGCLEWTQEFISDSGTVSITVNGLTEPVSYGSGSTDSSIASALASAFNSAQNSVVTASANGGVVSFTSKTTGAGTNYSLSATSSTSQSQYFSVPSFTTTTSGGSLTSDLAFGSLGAPQVTLYTYDAANNLTGVVQGAQTRTFVYDGLSRKISETTPEGGTVSLNFSGCSGDTNNVCSKTDARGITTAYTYDALNRIKSKSYSNGQGSVSYTYDQGGASAFAMGRLTQMADPSGSESYTYDADGDLLQLQKVIGSTTYTLQYKYNVGGEPTQITYPSGRVVQYAYDAIGRLCNVAPANAGSCSASSSYATSYAYDSAGHVTGITFGNGIVGTFNYFPKTQQIETLSYAKGSSNLFSLNYWYQNDSTNCPNGTWNDDGPIQCITDNMDSGRTVNYAYDGVNRLISATTDGSANYPKWGLSESYDQYSNRTVQSVTAGSGPPSSLGFNGNNQPTGSGFVYDASGNMTYDPATMDTYGYDADNQMVSVSGGAAASYAYDANGIRVEKSANGATTVFIYTGSEDIAEYDNGAAPSSPSREFIYGNGELLAQVSGGATTYYQKDHLSVRMVTDASGNVLGQEGHFPFGEAWYSANGNSEWVFTSYQHNQETGLEYAMARYYDPRTATFCSADPVEGDPADPASWNRYVYVRDNPVNLTDPSGEFLGGLVAFIVGLALAAITGNPKFIPIVGLLGSIAFPGVGPGPTTFPGSSATVTWEQLAIPGYNNVGRFVVPTFPNTGSAGASGGPEGNTSSGASNGSLESRVFRRINNCVGKVFGAKASRVPVQTLRTAPAFNTTETEAQLGAQTNWNGVLRPNAGPHRAAAMPAPNEGPNGTVYIASEIASGSNFAAFAGVYIHEYGNILSEKYIGSYSLPWNQSIGKQGDTDTGANFQHCVYPSSVNF
ncbi:MAG: RHS repeat domain-containing protein [Candidatus Acidiferrales bacterium]